MITHFFLIKFKFLKFLALANNSVSNTSSSFRDTFYDRTKFYFMFDNYFCC